MQHLPTLPLNETTALPLLGFDTEGLKGQQCVDMVAHALAVGHRHIEMADRDNTHAMVRSAIKASGIPREELFLTSRVWWNSLERDQVRRSFEDALLDLGVDHLDLYMIHWPNRSVPFSETFAEMREFIAEGKLKAIGVANFTERHLTEARATGVELSVHEFEVHPSFVQHELIEHSRQLGMHVMTTSVFGSGKDLVIPEIHELADGKFIPATQVILAWARYKKIAVTQLAHEFSAIDEYFGSLAVTLTPEEIDVIDRVADRGRLFDPPFADFSYR